MFVITVPGMPGIETPGSGFPESLSGPDDTIHSIRQLTQAMAGFGIYNGALDTSSLLEQHNASPVTGMLFSLAGQSHP